MLLEMTSSELEMTTLRETSPRLLCRVIVARNFDNPFHFRFHFHFRRLQLPLHCWHYITLCKPCSLVNLNFQCDWHHFFALSACQIISSSLFCLLFWLIWPTKIPPRCYTTAAVLSRRGTVVQAPEDSSWYAERMKTAGTVNN